MSIIPCLTGTETEVILVGNDGTRHNLITACAPYALAQRATIRGMATWDVTSRIQGPNIPGEAITQIRAAARTITVPLIVNSTAGTELGLDTSIADLPGHMSPEQGPCSIIYQRADGTQREITAYYTGGADRLEIVDLSLYRHTVAPLEFRALNPFWRDVNSTQGTIATTTFPNGALALADHLTVTNTSDVTTWPSWTFTGPLENIEIGSVTTSQLFRIDEIIPAGSTVRITTDPADRSVWLDDDLRWDILDPIAAELFPLNPGPNILVLAAVYGTTVTGGTYTANWPLLWETC